ncbi:MAG TPA: VWA domain-containing protein [Campylobacterales bacterium]|nr:VWA domain-containing protein [Campylobacterales bacterium]
MNFSLGYPYTLLLLMLLPCFIWCKIKAKRLYFSKPEWLPQRTLDWDNTTLWIMIIYTLLVFALASPYYYDNQVVTQKKGRDLVLILDTSGSMGERGFNKSDGSQSKYDISVSLAQAFIKNRADDNVGLVVFGTFAFTASPLTYDLKALNEMFGLMSNVGIAGTSTAIGDALIQGVNTLNAGVAKSKVLILLTDGNHNAGKSSPRQAVTLAKKKGIKIYTIGIGEAFDKALLKSIAIDSNAQSFSAKSSAELKEVYNHINKLEPSPIRSKQYLNKELLFTYPLFLAILGLLILILRHEERQ